MKIDRSQTPKLKRPKTITDVRNDKRVYDLYYGDEDEFGEPTWECVLRDGWHFYDGTSVMHTTTIKEMCDEIDGAYYNGKLDAD